MQPRLLRPVWSQPHAGWRYGGAVALSLVFIALSWVLGTYVGYDSPFPLLFVPIALSAFYGGLGPGLVSILVLVALADYFLIPPLYTLGLPDTRAVVTNLLFAVAGLIVSGLGEIGRNALRQASNDAEILRAAQQQLRVNEERLRITEQAVSGGVWDWDIQKNSAYWSAGYLRLCDFSLNERASYDLWLDSVHPDDRESVVEQLTETFSHRRHNWASEYRIRTATGRSRWVSSRGHVFYDEAGEPRRMVGINFDTTAQHATEAHTRLPNARVGNW